MRPHWPRLKTTSSPPASRCCARSRSHGHFDFAHLRAIHRYLFGPIYAWAGEPRTVAIGKGGSLVALPAYIAPYAEQVFGALAREDYLRALEPAQVVRRAAYYLAEINALHPFREGNGRTQREFLRELAARAGYEFAWEGTTAAAMTEASIRGMHGDLSGFEDILRDIIRPSDR